jgi:signal transduction histidine kinase/ligand-binding sensor domain-containing protein
LVIAAVALSADRTFAADLNGALTGYKLTSWNHINGLPHDDVVHALAQDGNGYLWIGTDDGLIRFDGARFVRWDALSGVHLPPGAVQLLVASTHGGFWLVLRQQNRNTVLSHIEGTTVHTYGSDGPPIRRATALFEDPSGAIWVGGDAGLFKLAEDRWVQQTVGGKPIGAVLAGYSGHSRIVVAATDGVFEQVGGRPDFERISSEHRSDTRPVVGETSDTSAIAVADQGVTILTDPLSGFRLTGQQPPMLHERGRGYRLLYDSHDNLWVGTFGQGLWRVRLDHAPSEYSVQIALEMTGLPSDGVLSLLEDRDATIWVGTSAGLCRLTRQDIAQVRGLGVVRGVAADAVGDVWVGTSDELIRFAQGSTVPSSTRASVGPAHLQSLTIDDIGSLWIATDRDLKRAHGPAFRPLATTRGPTMTWLATDHSGHNWFQDTTGKLVHENAEGLKTFDPPAETGNTSVAGSYADSSGRLWLSLRDGRVAVVGVDAPGVLDERKLTAGPSHAFFEDASHVMWIGGPNGLSRVSAAEAVTVHSSFPGEITAIIEDTSGVLWLAVNGAGIVRLSKTEFDKSAHDIQHQLAYTIYTREEGLAGVPSSYGTGLRATRAADGRLWFVTGSGLTIVDPSLPSEAQRRYPVRIEEIIVDNVRYVPKGNLRLPPRTSTLEIDYTALNLASAFRSRFKYRLDGVDDTWVDAGTRQEAFYANLSPRMYRFSVISSDDQGSWNATPSSIEFSIQPMFYQTTTFYVLSGVAFAMTLWLFWVLRVRRLRKVFSLVIAERLRLSREMHDTLLQGLVSVALQFEAIANEPTKVSAEGRDQVRGLRRRIEECIRDVRQSISELRQSAAQPRDLVAALNTSAVTATAGNDLKVDFAVNGTPLPCTSEVQGQLVKIAREAIVNSVRHARATRIKMEVLYEKTMLKLRISDDGSGFDPDGASDSRSHYGLVGMRERAESVGGSFNIVSQPGAGTAVEVNVPIGRTRRSPLA